MIKKIAPAVKGYLKYTILSPLLMIGEVIMECLIPITMGNIVDNGITRNDIHYVIVHGLMMVMFACISLFCGCMAGRFSSIASVGFAKNLRKMLFDKVQTFSFANVDKFSTGSLITRLTNDVTNTQNAFLTCIRMLFRAPITFVVAIIMCLKLSPKLSLSFTVFVPIIAIALVIIMNMAFPKFNEMLNAMDALNTDVQENLTAIRIVKAFVRGDFERKKFNSAVRKVKDTQLSAEKIVIWTMPVMQFCMYACNIIVAWFGAKIVLGGGMGTGALMSFFTYIAQILMSLMMISMIFMQIVISKASVKRIAEVLDEVPDISSGNSKDDVKDGEIEFKDVSFSYSKNPDNLTLKDINLHIKAGQTVGIIGGTGSAKSSLVQLIPRLYDVQGGEILVGGKNVKEYDVKTLRDAVSMVLQKNVLFSGTIEDNLRWGDENATEEQIIEACKAAQAHDFVMSFPNGYQTDLGQGGVNVSGGQKQRLCIARALLKHPKVLILDDSTSACDTATDSKIRASFKSDYLKDVTKIIIAQRITSVMDSDLIVILDEGKILASGTHDELMENSEVYREIYTSQQKGAEE